MGFSEEPSTNPLKRSFDCMSSKPPEAMDVDKDRSFSPEKIFEVAMQRNTIAVLENGEGKATLASMMINEFGRSLNNSCEKKLIIFLAPTVALVRQQCEVIKCQAKVRVEEIFGAKGVDDWSRETWEQQINEHDVLVMTPQILWDALRKAFLTLDIMCLMILDECHYATGHHPYAKIMKDFYHDESGGKPKVFGMTASPIIWKGLTYIKDYKQISDLEGVLDSQICTGENKVQLQVSVSSAKVAKEILRFYDPSVSFTLKLKEKLDLSLSKFDAALVDLQSSLAYQYRDTDGRFTELLGRLSDDHANIVCCLENLGLIGAYEAIKVCRENAPADREGCEVFQKGSSQLIYYLGEVSSIIQESLPQNLEMLPAFDYSSPEAVSLGYVSSKLHELIEVLKNLGKENKVISLILVERMITAKVIERIIKRIAYLSHFTFSYLTESSQSVNTSAPALQVNLVFATDVVEKGIDVPRFSSVVFFDLPKKVDSYVLLCGRARESGSQYIVMLERDNLKQRNNLFELNRCESSMINTATNGGTNCSRVKAYPKKVTITNPALNRDTDPAFVKDTNVYCVEATGESVSTKTSVSLIQRYCEKLPRDKSFIPKPAYQFLLEGQLYRCQLTLPPNAAFQTMIGSAAGSSLKSKQLVCLEACKKLHQAGSLNDYLLPLGEDPSRKASCPNSKAVAAGAGTTKRKELHGTTSIQALSGTWGGNSEGFSFHAYKVDFACHDKDHCYSSFVLFLESDLDNDVGNIQMDLYLRSKFVKSSVSACGQRYLNGKEVAKAKCFQELFFNGLFGKLLVKTSSGERKLLFETQEALWDPSKMYLLLPLKPLMNCAQPWEINWMGIESSVSVVEFLKRYAWINSEVSENRRKSLMVNQTYPVDGESAKIIHLANKSVNTNDLKNMVVISIHTGRIYSIMKDVENSSAESPFDGNSDPESPSYSSFADYFSTKYGIVLVHPAQPLLLLKQSHNAHNLLVDFRNEHGGITLGNGSQEDSKMLVQKPRCYAYMPPELLISVDVPADVLKSFYLLPSLMYRLESLMLASQLRKNVVPCSDNFHISSSLILEALTTLKCNETFSMERLELFGDSVLKYAVSCDLFLKYPKEHEGQLTAQRSKIICNSALHKLGTDRKLQGYIRDGAFELRRWTAPGQLSLWPCRCEHGVDYVEVPLDVKFTTEDIKVKVGKSCDKGHRWMGSKTIADCVEALIGAYYVGGGLIASLNLMQWMGINAIAEPALVHDSIKAAFLHVYSPKVEDIECLEVKLGYKFKVKGLLLEAITHAAEQDQDASLSYERLEFLGDAVLDILVTKYLYYNHTEIDPGELTDLRAASVNNDNFALAAVKKLLHPHLQCFPSYLNNQISTYVKSVSDSFSRNTPVQSINAPKVLGDLLESIAGAILIDTRLNLDEVWRIFEPLLSPIVTPDKLELPPLRELIELCDSLGYHVKTNYGTRGDEVKAELSLQLEDVLWVEHGFGKNRKTARGQAALHLLKKLEEKGISNPKRSKEGNSNVCNPSLKSSGCEGRIGVNAEATRMEHNERQPDGGPILSVVDLKDIPVIPPIEMKKGGPRNALFDLCKKQQWPMPTFECSELKSRTPMVFGEGSEQRTVYISFESKIKLIIPNSGTIVVTGEARPDKKASFDSAASTMLFELQRQLKIVISGQ